jgi:hypothetical protein
VLKFPKRSILGFVILVVLPKSSFGSKLSVMPIRSRSPKERMSLG